MEAKNSIKTTFHRCILKDLQGRQDYDFIRLALKQKQLTFKMDFLNPKYKPQYWETPYKEISFTSPKERIQPEYNYLLNNQSISTDNIISFSKDLVNGIKHYLAVNLKEGEEYLMLHSGGYDSRIISACMRDLWEEGMRFNIHFRCHQPEEPIFLKIMKREGWDKSFYSIYPGRKENYYNIGNKENHLNGWHNHNQTMNFWSDIISDEKKYTLIIGFGGELFKYIAVHSKDYCPKRCSNDFINILLQFYPDEGQWDAMYMMQFKDLLMPFFSYSYMKHSLTANPEWCKYNGETDTIRIEMTKRFKYDITNIPYGRHDYSWNLSDRFFKKLEKDFYDSLFFKKYGEYISKKPDFTKLYGWDAKLWGWMTVYDAIFNNERKS